MMKQRTAVVSGASSGIGAEIALALSESHSVLLLGRDKERLQFVQSELHGQGHWCLSLDLASSLAEEELDQFLKENGVQGIDVLINNAGVYLNQKFEETALEDWHRLFQINLFGSIQLTRACLSRMFGQPGAHIVNIASTLGVRPVANTTAYSASKAAMINWTQSLALELAPQKIRVNSISPGLIETPLHDFYKTQDSGLRNQLDGLQPLGFLGQPRHIAQAVKFLCSENSDWTTGANFVIDGGISIA